MKGIIIASNNEHKVREIKAVLKLKNVKVISLREAGFKKDIKETGATLKENAAIKARQVRRKFRDKIIISDDSGLEVEYLAGAPGVFSARFAGARCTYKDNNRKLLRLLRGAKQKERKASFRTVACIAFEDGEEIFAEGRVDGRITEKLMGTGGFGYDPLFMPKGYRKTYAMMSEKDKNSISHRKKAFKKAASIIRKKYSMWQAELKLKGCRQENNVLRKTLKLRRKNR